MRRRVQEEGSLRSRDPTRGGPSGPHLHAASPYAAPLRRDVTPIQRRRNSSLPTPAAGNHRLGSCHLPPQLRRVTLHRSDGRGDRGGAQAKPRDGGAVARGDGGVRELDSGGGAASSRRRSGSSLASIPRGGGAPLVLLLLLLRLRARIKQHRPDKVRRAPWADWRHTHGDLLGHGGRLIAQSPAAPDTCICTSSFASSSATSVPATLARGRSSTTSTSGSTASSAAALSGCGSSSSSPAGCSPLAGLCHQRPAGLQLSWVESGLHLRALLRVGSEQRGPALDAQLLGSAG